jgi:hypothetical protein
MRKTERVLLGCLLWLPLAVAAAPPPGLPGLPPAAPPAPRTDPAAGWSALVPAQQRDLRARYAAWRALPESERQRIRQAAARVAALSAAERDALRARFAGQDQLHRDGWRLGPQLGALYPKLQPLLGYVPAEQREPLLTLLRQLDPEQLAQLTLIAQRTPPQDRAELRAQLLGVSAAGRGAWLREKVGH